ncbi:hypothetical protein FYC62_15390 [Pedobacter aquae]|uniref:Uncharacterized protein n=1 Tax=Pedobacter aquae TaxID=2605747 RepID=A0A5C0VNL4_9SPHI|nr:hypothetical protein [Pedobacter aquae]QEK52900.1 hypothetical protein FYC62_15390 [Pedobacter aquae]
MENFKRGLYRVLAYYFSGFIIAWLASVTFDWEYMHAPGIHHLIGFLFLLGGIISILYYIGLFLFRKKEKINLGALLVHLIVIIFVLMFIIF